MAGCIKMINELYIFNRDERKYIKHLSYVQLGIINNIKSLIWHEKFFDKGDFELVVPFSKENLELLQNWHVYHQLYISYDHHPIKLYHLY